MARVKRALILYPAGIGDVIMLTPCLRTLANAGYTVDMIVRGSVIDSKLLDCCPYIGTLYRTIADGRRPAYKTHHMPLFNSLKDRYDWTGVSTLYYRTRSRIKLISRELKLIPETFNLEVFVPDVSYAKAKHYVDEHIGGDFIFVHTQPSAHPGHKWDCSEFVKKNLPSLPVVNMHKTGLLWKDINTTFALMSMAEHRVLSSSVMVHACDALDLTIDAVNYEIRNSSCRPLKNGIIQREFVKGRLV